MVVALESLRTYVPRFELRQAGNQAAQLIKRARLEAVKRGVTTVVEANLEERTLRAFAEVNGIASDPLLIGTRYLVYDPEILKAADRTDYLISTMALPGKEETGVQFGGPQFGLKGADSVVGFTTVSQPSAEPVKTPVLVFTASGAIVAPGAFRFADARNANHFEIALTSLTGDVEIRKYLNAIDAPSGGLAAFFAEGNIVFSESRNIWVWY